MDRISFESENKYRNRHVSFDLAAERLQIACRLKPTIAADFTWKRCRYLFDDNGKYLVNI